MVQYYKPHHIIELGTSFGMTTAYLAEGNKSATVHTFEGSSAIAQIAQAHFESLSLGNIHSYQGDFDVLLPSFLEASSTIDLAFIDGNHREKPTLQYFKQLLAKSTDDTILIFDDIHWSAEMERAWAEIKAYPAVTLSIDLFFIGIVFVKKDFKVKQHFSIQF